MDSMSPPYRGVLYVVVGLCVARRVPEDLPDTIYGIPFSVAKTYPFLVIDTIHQGLGDRVMQQLHTRVGLLAHYFLVAQIDHEHLNRSVLSFGGTNNLIHLIDPFDQLSRNNRLHPSPERSCKAYLSKSLDGVTTLDIIQDISLLTDVFGKERAARLLQRFFRLGLEPTSHLFDDPDLQQSFRLAFSPSVMIERSVTAPSVTTLSSISGRSTASTDTVPRQIDHSSNVHLGQNRRGRPTNDRRGSHRHHDSASSTYSTSTASTPEKKGVKCEWTGCERHVPFLTPRGLREHYMLKHEIPSKQAHNEAKAAFETAAEYTPRAQFLDVPGTPYDSHLNRDSRPGHTDFEGIGYQFPAEPTTDLVAPSMPLTPLEANMTLQSFPPYDLVSGLMLSLHDQGSFDADSLGVGLLDQPELSWNDNYMSNLAEDSYPMLFGEINNGNAVNFAGSYTTLDRQDLLDRRASPTYDSSS